MKHTHAHRHVVRNGAGGWTSTVHSHRHEHREGSATEDCHCCHKHTPKQAAEIGDGDPEELA